MVNDDRKIPLSEAERQRARRKRIKNEDSVEPERFIAEALRNLIAAGAVPEELQSRITEEALVCAEQSLTGKRETRKVELLLYIGKLIKDFLQGGSNG